MILGKPNVRRLANRCEMCLGRARGNPIFRVAALSTDETGRLIVVDGYFIRYLHTQNHRQAFGPMESVFFLFIIKVFFSVINKP